MRKHNKLVDKKITKFIEALWRFMFYSFFCVLGIRALFFPSTAPWVLDTRQHWEGWPLQPISDSIKFYYQIELAAYIHQLMWTEVSRSDTVEMVLHHLTTIMLVSFSFLTSFTRIGSSIFLVHDLSDVFLEAAKVFNYTSKAKGHKWASTFCDTLFVLFAVSFFVLRLIVYPRYLVYSLVVEAPEIMGMWPCYWVFATLLVVLQCLHVFWFYLIARMVPSLLQTGIQKDERSDDEDDGMNDVIDDANADTGGQKKHE
jgi:ceramide synthetase